MAFGHGIHQCVGRHLARLELTVALRALFTRHPRLRLAVPGNELRAKRGVVIGLAALPVLLEPESAAG